MDATIKLYTRACKIEAEKLQMIENIADYLNSKEANPLTYTIQYQKISLNMYVKILLNETYMLPLKNTNYVYCSITQDSKVYYFYIKKFNWKSNQCIELDLVMDVLNTFKMGVDYTFSPKTLITRQHKDRVSLYGNYVDLVDSYVVGGIRKDYLYIVLTTYFSSLPFETIRNTATEKEEHVLLSNIPCNFYEMEYDENLNTLTKLHEYNCQKVWIYRHTDKLTRPEPTITYKYELDLGTLPTTKIDLFNEDNYTCIRYSDNISPSLTQIAVLPQRFREDGFKLIKNVDKESENLNPTLYGKFRATSDRTSRRPIKDKHQVGDLDCDWCLVYNKESEDENTAIETYLIPEKSMDIELPTNFKGIQPSMLQDGIFYNILLKTPATKTNVSTPYFNGTEYGLSNFKLPNGNTIPSVNSARYGTPINSILQVKKRGNQLICSVIVFAPSSLDGSNPFDYYLAQGLSFLCDYISYEGNETSLTYGESSIDLDFEDSSTLLGDIDDDFCVGHSWNISQTAQIVSISGIGAIDKTYSTIVKIIRLPYIPVNFSVHNTRYVINNDWEITLNVLGGATALKLVNTGMKFEKTINTNPLLVLSPVGNLITSLMSRDEISPSATRRVASNYGEELEGKIFHSEFFQPKFFYDSFSLVISLELLENKYAVDDYLSKISDNIGLQIKFHMTTTITCNFAFEIDFLEFTSMTDQDIPAWLVVARNNEEVIYNDAYVNYLRTGYNWDIKNKTAQSSRNWVMATGSVATAVIATIGAVATKGMSTPLAVMAISGAISSVATITNAVMTDQQNERNIQQKLDTAKMQSATISGSDDLDLMTRYCGNRLQLMYYLPNERVQSLLNDLFYYYGYKDNRMGVPNMNTRYWFNYLQCKAVLDFSSINMSEEIENELKGIMENGFTFFHQHGTTWDIDQVKENWENSVLNAII